MPASLGLLLAAAPAGEADRHDQGLDLGRRRGGRARPGASAAPWSRRAGTGCSWSTCRSIAVAVVAGRPVPPSAAPGQPGGRAGRRGERRRCPTSLGAVVFTVAVGALALGLVKADDWGWTSPGAVRSLAAAAALLVRASPAARPRHPAPVIEPHLLRHARLRHRHRGERGVRHRLRRDAAAGHAVVPGRLGLVGAAHRPRRRARAAAGAVLVDRGRPDRPQDRPRPGRRRRLRDLRRRLRLLAAEPLAHPRLPRPHAPGHAADRDRRRPHAAHPGQRGRLGGPAERGSRPARASSPWPARSASCSASRSWSPSSASRPSADALTVFQHATVVLAVAASAAGLVALLLARVRGGRAIAPAGETAPAARPATHG